MDWKFRNPFRRTQKSSQGGFLGIGGHVPRSWPVNWWQRGMTTVNQSGTSTVQACTDAYAHTIATMSMFHYKIDKNGTKTPIFTSPMAKLLNRPNSYQTRSDFMLNLVKYLLLKGNSYVVGIRDDRGNFESMHTVPAQGTMPYIEPESKAVFYAIGSNPLMGELSAMVPARDVMHLRLYCPRNPLVGVSPIENAALAIAANAAISAHQANFFNNMSRPSGILSTEQKLNEDQMKQLRTAWEEQAKQMSSGGVPILSSGITWESMALSSIDSQMVEAFNMSVNDIARAFRVPLPLIQQHDQGSTYNNVEQMYSQWLSGGLGFQIEHLEQNFNYFFGLPPNESLHADTDSLLRTDFAGRVDGYTKLVTGGVMKINEARTKLGGLKPVPHGDDVYVQSQMVPLGTIPDSTSTEPTSSDPPDPDLADEPDDNEEASLASTFYLRKALGYD